jgi:NAD(P)-dependent dehydrogenase (short-subunit alcohol dehydrogenase family)
MKSTKKKIFVITGAGAGFGRAFAEAALKAEHTVVGTVRRQDDSIAFEALHYKRAKAAIIDVARFESIDPTIQKIEADVGPIDVLVNNAGYGQLGAFEQISGKAVARQFATNVFGVFDVTRAVLPLMRSQGSGHVVTISSLCGLVGVEGASIYCASKFAVAGWSEALSLELAPFGIRFTVVEPGMFRTDFLDELSMQWTDVPVAEYAEFDARRRSSVRNANHLQGGDPVALGGVVGALVRADQPPTHFAAGSDAFEAMVERAHRDLENAEQWCSLSASTDRSD